MRDVKTFPEERFRGESKRGVSKVRETGIGRQGSGVAGGHGEGH